MSAALDPKVKQILIDMAKSKSQLLEPFIALPEVLINEQTTLQELMQRCRALSTATKDYLINEDPNNPAFRIKAEQLEDIATDPSEKQAIGDEKKPTESAES